MPESYTNSQTVIDLAKDFHAEPELAAKKMNAPLDKVLATLNTK